MALPNEVNVGRFNQLLYRLLQIKGGSPAPVLTPELLASIVLEADRIEWAFLSGELLFSHRAVNTPIAGQRGRQVYSLAASVQAIAVFEVISPESNEIRVRSVAAAGGVAFVPDRRDGRIELASSTPLTLLQDSVATSVGFAITPESVGNSSRPQWVVTPGSGLELVNTAITVDIAVSVAFRIRPLEQSEARR